MRLRTHTAAVKEEFNTYSDRLENYKILLVQVGTLSFSHPLFGVPVLFIY